MDDFQKRVLEKLDKMDDRLNSVDKTLAEQHISLKEHIRRTEVLEQEMKPIKENVAMFKGATKFVGFVGIVVGMITALFKLLNK